MKYFQINKKPVIRNRILQFAFLFLLLIVSGALPAQFKKQKRNDNPLQLAEQHFADGQYYTAAKLYEQHLNPVKKQIPKSDFPLIARRNRSTGTTTTLSKTDILYKQAECYRLANYWQQASALYKECAEKDPSTYKDALYWYAVCLRSLEKYDTAFESIIQYLSNSNGTFKDAATKELETLKFIQQQLARPDSVLFHVQKINATNSSEKGMFAPASFNGNQFFITSTQTDTVLTEGINPYHNRLFSATYNNGTLENMLPVSVAAEANVNQGAACMSADGKYLYFTQWTKQNGKTFSSIYFSTKNSEGWSNPILLNGANVNGSSSKQPFCSKDGKFLYFASDRSGGAGKSDIWIAPINADGTTGEPMNAGAMVNSADDEQAPFYHTETATLIFSSNGRTGMGGYDLFTSKGNEKGWSMPQNMGHPVNSSRDDIYFYAAEQNGLLRNTFISSDRGSECCLETFVVTKDPKKQKFTGVIRDLTTGQPVAGADVVLKDASGKTWKLVTDADGVYKLDFENNVLQSLHITKEFYKEKITTVNIHETDETDWLTDIRKNKDEFIEKRVILRPETVVTVYFDFDKYYLKDSAILKLDSIYNVLTETPGASLQISGYTDGFGTVEYNKVLSDRRARACYQYLVNRGIDSSRITFESFGACCPLEMELINGMDNAEGRAKNRRALINVVMPKQD